MQSAGTYFRTLSNRFGAGWTRFWFAPSDPTTLGVIRILTAAIALALYLSYVPDLERLFGPDGLLSRDAILQVRGTIRVFSIFDYARSSTTLWIFYWAGAAALAMMLVGLFTRVTAVLALVAVLSLIHRGPMLSRPVDEIVALLMFYLCLGPCGRRFSIDAWLQGEQSPFAARTAQKGTVPGVQGAQGGGGQSPFAARTPQKGTVPGVQKGTVPGSSAATISTRLIQVHLSAIYLAMALAKLRGSIGTGIWWNGSAAWDLLARPEYPLVSLTGLGFSDASYYLLNLWTLAILAFEFCFAILIWNRLARPLLLGISLFIWIGIAVLTGMVSFALIMLVAGLAFVPPATFRRLRLRPK